MLMHMLYESNSRSAHVTCDILRECQVHMMVHQIMVITE